MQRVDIREKKILSSGCAVASGVAVEFIACRAGPVCTWSLQRRKSRGRGTRWIFRLGGAGREQASLTQQPVAGSGQGASAMMRS
jgi:hypothetical protein